MSSQDEAFELRMQEIATQLNRLEDRLPRRFLQNVLSAYDLKVGNGTGYSRLARRLRQSGGSLFALVGAGILLLQTDAGRRFWSQVVGQAEVGTPTQMLPEDASRARGAQATIDFRVTDKAGTVFERPAFSLAVGIPVAVLLNLETSDPLPSFVQIELSDGLDFFAPDLPQAQELRLLSIRVPWKPGLKQAEAPVLIRATRQGRQSLTIVLQDQQRHNLGERTLELDFEGRPED